MQVITDDSSTLIRLVREGYATDLKLTFSWRYMTWMYLIQTKL